MNYYKGKQAANKEVERIIKESKRPIKRIQLVYELTIQYLVGELSMNKRIDLLISLEVVKETEKGLVWIGNKDA